MSDSSYQKLGASASKAGLHRALEKSGASTSHSHFAQLVRDFAGDPNYYSFVHCDGAGTKSIVSYLAFKETGDTSWFSGLAQDALVMNLDDVICLGKPEGLVVSNLINRNSSLVNDDILSEIIAAYMRLQADLAKYGVTFDLGGGETADCGDITRTIAVDAVIAGRIAKENLLSTDNIAPGNLIVGLSGAGQANWEKTPNSGIGSNGLTLARHTLLQNSYAKQFPEVVDPEVDSSAIYQGPFSVLDKPSGLGSSVAEALLSPTRTFAPVLLGAFEKYWDSINACIHVSGGALSKVLRFGKGNHYIKNDLIDAPEIFKLIQKTGDISWQEMYQVFNMGQRMEIYCDSAAAEGIIAISKSLGVDAKIIGHVEENSESKTENRVTVESGEGKFTYTL